MSSRRRHTRRAPTSGCSTTTSASTCAPRPSVEEAQVRQLIRGGTAMRLSGSTFLVTGGGSGLGAACVRAFVAGGASVLVADVNGETGERLAAELGEQVRFAQTDVTDEESVRQAVASAREAFGGLHGAVNCAGIGIAERVVGKAGPHPLGLFNKVIQVNLIGTFNVIRLAAAALAEGEPNAEGERG